MSEQAQAGGENPNGIVCTDHHICECKANELYRAKRLAEYLRSERDRQIVKTSELVSVLRRWMHRYRNGDFNDIPTIEALVLVNDTTTILERYPVWFGPENCRPEERMGHV